MLIPRHIYSPVYFGNGLWIEFMNVYRKPQTGKVAVKTAAFLALYRVKFGLRTDALTNLSLCRRSNILQKSTQGLPLLNRIHFCLQVGRSFLGISMPAFRSFRFKRIPVSHIVVVLYKTAFPLVLSTIVHCELYSGAARHSSTCTITYWVRFILALLHGVLTFLSFST